MSSCGNPSAEAEALMTKRPKYDHSKACVKCKLKTGNVVIRHAVYCKECFFPLISIRFRRTLEPHVNPTPQLHRRKGLKASGNLLVGFSGGLGSTVLLDLVHKTYLIPPERQDGDLNPNGGCPWPKVLVAFVDISGALATTQSENRDIRQVVESYGSQFEYISLKLENAFDQNWWREIGGFASHQHYGFNITNEGILLEALSDDTSSPAASLRTYIKSLPTSTAVANAIQNLVRMLLLYSAASNRCSHLLLGTSLTSLSISLISSISQGGGYSMKEEAQEEWVYRHHIEHGDRTVRVIRPLRDVGSKECAVWAWWCSLRIVRRHRHSGGRQDINALTRSFIMGLEKDYPSTVSTIARTCNKLTTKEDSYAKCILCERPIQPGIQEWKHKISIRSYRDENSNTVLPSHFQQLAIKSQSDPITTKIQTLYYRLTSSNLQRCRSPCPSAHPMR
ncbi:Cytoplasmic tRNA 2-thiolation protein 2 [Leucoagaricus sp. SymC.cos]|nr:Cytoplasmic tRNA 2-thiolation protein 2 [Leucoagaricus sp. SymC.cos]